MRPQVKGPWRKTLRSEAKGVDRGRHPRPIQTNPPRPGSTWLRRHMQAMETRLPLEWEG